MRDKEVFQGLSSSGYPAKTTALCNTHMKREETALGMPWMRRRRLQHALQDLRGALL